jgi:formiminotetrahydrofolate cyclodeaminase
MKLMTMSTEDLLAEIAARSPAPGGGSAAALAGSVAASLCEMVAGLTLGREKHRDAWPEMEKAESEARRLGAGLRRLVDEDTEAYNSVVAARRLPKATEAERMARDAAIQSAVARAARAPLETLELLTDLSAVALLVVEKGSPGCVTDAGSAGEMIEAGARSAFWNVRINLPGLRDASLGGRLSKDAEAALARVVDSVQRIRAVVERHLPRGSES